MSTENVLILHAGALGDFVLTLHLVDALRLAWGSPSVTLAARSPLALWTRKHGLVSETCTLDWLGLHRLYDASREPPEELLSFIRRFDRVVSFLGDSSAPVSVRLSEICGTEVPAIDPRVAEATLRDGLHITRQWADQLAAFGRPVSEVSGAVINLNTSLRRDNQRLLAECLGEGPGRTALCHPGSGGLEKCCPLECLESLVCALFARGLSVGWMIGPDEIERHGYGYRERLEASAPVVFEESVEAAADLVCGAQVYIGNDTGMTHVAAVAGVQTFAIFGPTDPRVWRPLGDTCHVIRFPTDGRSFDGWTENLVLRINRIIDPSRGL